MISEETYIGKIFLLLDASGSMKMKKGYTVQSINEYVNGLLEIDDIIIDIVIFDNTRYDLIYTGTPKNFIDIGGLGKLDYDCIGSTPLIDSYCNSIVDLIKIDKSVKKLFVVITDGLENCSRIYNYDDAKLLTETFEKDNNGKIIFLGESYDYAKATMVSKDFGFNIQNTIVYNYNNPDVAYRSVGLNTQSYFSSTDNTGDIDGE